MERDLEAIPDQYQGQRLFDALSARLAKLPPPPAAEPQRSSSPNASGSASPPASPRQGQARAGNSPSRPDARASPLLERPLERALVARDKALTVSRDGAVARAGTDGDAAVAEFVMQLSLNDQVVRFQALMAAEGCVWSGTDNGWIYTWATDGKQLRSFQAHQKTVYSIVRVRNTAWSSSSEGVIRVWPLELPERATAVRVMRELPVAQNHKVLLLAHPSGVVSFDTSGAVCMWNAEVRADAHFTPQHTRGE